MESVNSTGNFTLSLDERGKLTLTFPNGEVHRGVTPKRLFPFTDPDRWLSLINSAGKEIAIVENVASLPRETIDLIRAELSKCEFLPTIQRVLKISGLIEPCDWTVETDRGRTTFILNNDEDIRRVNAQTSMITSASGIRFLVANPDKLDAGSRRYLERYL